MNLDAEMAFELLQIWANFATRTMVVTGNILPDLR